MNLYSKKNLSNLNSKFKKINYNHSKIFLNSIDKVYRIFDKDIIDMGVFDTVATLNSSQIKLCFFPDNIRQRALSVFSNENIEASIIIPFVSIQTDIVEIPNSVLIKQSNLSKESEIELDEIYTDIKNIILEYAKKNKKKWYKAYQRGLNFKATDLSAMEKLYKPIA